MLLRSLCVLMLLFASVVCRGDGPADRAPTDPKSVVSKVQAGALPVQVADVLQTTSIASVALSPDAAKIAYVGNQSGRLNLWLMNADGSGQTQLLKSNDRQSGVVFTRDGKELVYMQDKGGDELYDLYAVGVGGGEPRNLTQTEHTSEVGPRFSKDGTMLAFGAKEKKDPYTNIAVMAWPGGEVRLLTHETDPKATWGLSAWSPDGRFIYAERSVEQEDSDLYRIEVKTGAAEKLTGHAGKEVLSASDISPDGKTLLGSSNRKGGFTNVGLFDLETKQWRWVTDTQWQAGAEQFAPDGKSFTYGMNVNGRAAIEFTDVTTLKTTTRGLPLGLNFPSGLDTAFAPEREHAVCAPELKPPGKSLLDQTERQDRAGDA